MSDLALDSDFSVFLDDQNEVATVDGREYFEQSVRVMITDYLYSSVLGESDIATIKQKINLQVSRVAREHDELDGISRITVEQSEDDPHTYLVRINYTSDYVSELQISE